MADGSCPIRLNHHIAALGMNLPRGSAASTSITEGNICIKIRSGANEICGICGISAAASDETKASAKPAAFIGRGGKTF